MPRSLLSIGDQAAASRAAAVALGVLDEKGDITGGVPACGSASTRLGIAVA